MKKFIIISVIIIIPLLIAGYLLLNRENGVSIEWETKAVELGDMEITITATGTLEAVKEVRAKVLSPVTWVWTWPPGVRR